MSTFAPSFASVPDTQITKVAALTINLAQAAATYDAGTVSGGPVMLMTWGVYVSVVGTLFTSVSVQTNDTVPVELLSAAEGALANVLAGKNLKVSNTAIIIPSGKKIQYTLIGLTGTGTMLLYAVYKPLAVGAVLA